MSISFKTQYDELLARQTELYLKVRNKSDHEPIYSRLSRQINCLSFSTEYALYSPTLSRKDLILQHAKAALYSLEKYVEFLKSSSIKDEMDVIETATSFLQGTCKPSFVVKQIDLIHEAAVWDIANLANKTIFFSNLEFESMQDLVSLSKILKKQKIPDERFSIDLF